MSIRSQEEIGYLFYERLAVSLSTAPDWDSAMQLASRLLITEFQLKSIVFGLANSRRQLFDIRQFFRHSIPYDTKILWENTGLFSLFEKMELLQLADISEMPDSKSGDVEIWRDFPGALLAVPLQTGQRALGVLVLLRGKNVAFTEIEQQKAKAGAALLGLLWGQQNTHQPQMNWDSGDFWQQMFQNLMDGIAEPVVIASDSADLIYHSNIAFQALTGLSEEVLHGMPWTSLHPCPERGESETAEYEAKIMLSRREGAPVAAIVHCKPLIEQPGKVLAIYYPVLSETASAPDKAKTLPAISDSDETLPLWQILHDVKTPLSAVRGFSQLILDHKKDALPGDILHFAQRINHNGLLLEQLVEDLRQHGKHMIPKMSPAIPVGRVIEQVMDNVSFLLEQHPITVELPETWPEVPGYELDLVRLWTNLLINAIQSAAARKTPVVRLTWQTDATGYRFGVFNNGPGIPENELPHLFNAVSEKHTVDSGMDENWGIGLSIVQTIIQRHKGQVWVESHSEEGVVFYFILPTGDAGARQDR